MKRALMFVFGAALLSGCMTSAPESYIADRHVLERAHLDRYPLVVVAVDGSSTTFHPLPIAPGQHQVTFDAPAVAGFHEPIQKTYPMAILPCTEYYVAADRVNRVTQDWDLVIEATRPVAGCSPDEEMKKARGEATASAAPGSSLISLANR